MKYVMHGVVSPDEAAPQHENLLMQDERWHAAWMTRTRHHQPTIRFDRPSRTLSISLTGQSCALQCAHCGGVYLRHMHSLSEANRPGITSLLMSGGCDALGRVPVPSTALAQIQHLHADHRMNWHVGFASELEIERIAPFVDVISFDMVGDRETAREVYGLDVGLEDYVATLDMLERHARVVPHITIGLRGGEISGEYAILEALTERSVEELVFIVLIPTPETRYADRQPPTLAAVADLLLQARLALPEAVLRLGCMRPYGAYRRALDVVAVRAGINSIVNPSRLAIEKAIELGLSPEWGEECCALG